jgi:hypothetical protein
MPRFAPVAWSWSITGLRPPRWAVDEDKSEAHVLLFNRQLHKISAQYIEFNQPNFRWEASDKGRVTFMQPLGL